MQNSFRLTLTILKNTCIVTRCFSTANKKNGCNCGFFLSAWYWFLSNEKKKPNTTITKKLAQQQKWNTKKKNNWTSTYKNKKTYKLILLFFFRKITLAGSLTGVLVNAKPVQWEMDDRSERKQLMMKVIAIKWSMY